MVLLLSETTANKHAFSLAHYVPMQCRFKVLNMSDIDFIRLSALVFATRLIGMTADPVSEGMDMAERLFNELKQKEVE